MKHVQTLNTKKLQNTVKKGGCGECQTSCQSACKTSCTVGNQSCENNRESSYLYNAERPTFRGRLHSVVKTRKSTRDRTLDSVRSFVRL